MITGIKHIIFDLGNVLLNINPQITHNALQKLSTLDYNKAFQQLSEAQVFERFETNDISAEQFIQLIMQHGQINSLPQLVIDAWNALLLDFPLRRLQILQQLQLHYDLVLLSNTNSIHEKAFNQILQQSHGIPNIGVFFDRVYYSHKIGLRKPDPKAFEYVIADCGFAPQNTLFIDDIEQNTLAAEKLGIKTIWLKDGMTIEKDIFLNRSNH